MSFTPGRKLGSWIGLLSVILFGLSCSGPASKTAPLTAEAPLHLEEHLDAATIEGSDVPSDVPATVEWRFDEPQPGWKRAHPWEFITEPARLVGTDDALRLVFEEKNRDSDGDYVGGLFIDLPDWRREDWAYVSVRARSNGASALGVAFNLTEPARAGIPQSRGEWGPIIADGSVHTYQMRADTSQRGKWESSWRQLILWAGSEKPSSIDILSVSVTPKEAVYAEAGVGVTTEVRNKEHRRALYTHAPGRVRFRVLVPEQGRLDIGLGVVRDDVPVTFRIGATPDDGASETLLEEMYNDQEEWAQRHVDLSHLSGRVVTLGLEAEAPSAGTVALWAAPTLSGARATDRPNVIFYIIDGAGADSMSVYGYNRRTTPNLERLAKEGAVFENAYSNSSWTMPSTASYLSSLQHSVIGGLKNGRNSPPEEVPTIAEHLKRAGYQTAFFTSNPNAGTMSHLERGVNVFREAGVQDSSTSSVELHDHFWRWREAYPAEPYWVRFQTTDVHGPNTPVPPFAGLYVSPENRETFLEWQEKLEEASLAGPYADAFEKTGISRLEYYDVARGLYDETMAHQDYQIGRLVERLKESGEWDRTLLIIASDHGQAAGTAHFGLGLLDPMPPVWEGAMLSSFQTRIPMIFVWPKRIPGGQRFREAASMIDMLPTILDLVGLPRPEVMQGQSLAPLLAGEVGWQPRPIILDEFRVTNSGEYKGWIEVIDGRWGASLIIDPSLNPGDAFLADPVLGPGEVALRGHRDWPVPGSSVWENFPAKIPRLLLYDLWIDPAALHSLHEERPDLVEKYTNFLEGQWEAHQALAKRFTRSEDAALTPEQLRTLRSLGYVQ